MGLLNTRWCWLEFAKWLAFTRAAQWRCGKVRVTWHELCHLQRISLAPARLEDARLWRVTLRQARVMQPRCWIGRSLPASLTSVIPCSREIDEFLIRVWNDAGDVGALTKFGNSGEYRIKRLEYTPHTAGVRLEDVDPPRRETAGQGGWGQPWLLTFFGRELSVT